MSRIVLGIDPGTTESGWCLYAPGPEPVVASGIWRNEELLDFPHGTGLDAPDLVAIEMVQSMGMAVGQEVFETVLWTGRLSQALGLFAPVRLCYRTQIKLHLCHSARAKDANIRQRLIDLFGPVGTAKAKGPLYGIKGHAWAALAVAVYASEVFDSEPMERSA